MAFTAALGGATTTLAEATRALAAVTLACLWAGTAHADEAGPRFGPALPDGTPALYAATIPPAPIERLTDALERAYWTNPEMLAERARTRGTDFRLPQARSNYGPQLEVQFGRGVLRSNVEQPAGNFVSRSGWTTTAAAVLNQPLFTFGRNVAAERTALAEIAFARAGLRFREGQILFDAIAAYSAVLRDRSGVAITAENLSILERELDDTQTRLRVRETTITDVDQVATRVELARAQQLAAQGAAASSEARFLSVVGARPGELEPPNPLVVPVATLEEAYALADRRSPLLEAAQAREKISRGQRDAARAERYPRVDLRGSGEVGTVSPYSDDLHQTDVRGEIIVSAPLFDSGLRSARAAEAAALNDADWRLIDNALRENRAEVAAAWNEWTTQEASLSRYQAAVYAARSAYEGAVFQERAGLRTTLDVIDLARELLSARNQYNNASFSAYVARARLLFAMGLLEHEELFPDAIPYRPEAHYEKVRNDSDLPLVTPLLRAMDTMGSPPPADRPIRDPAAQITAPPASTAISLETGSAELVPIE